MRRGGTLKTVRPTIRATLTKVGALKAKDHLDLYEEIKPILFQTGIGYQNLTEAQTYFVRSFEVACFDDNFLACYAKLVDSEPDISVRNLHAFCLGYGLGRSMNLQIDDNENNTNH